MQSSEISYFDGLIDSFDPKHSSRHVHLGYWPYPDQAPEIITYDEFSVAQQRLNDAIINHASLSNEQSILDIGCGLGGNIDSINQLYSQMQLTGLNIDIRQLDICKTVDPVNNNIITWNHGDACQLPYEDSSFDRVFSIEAMFHFDSREQLFSEVSRVLKSEGIFIATDILINNSADRDLINAVKSGYQPWPRILNDSSIYQQLTDNNDLNMIRLIDITRNTSPGHRFTAVTGKLIELDIDNAQARAGVALRELNDNRQLQYNLIIVQKHK